MVSIATFVAQEIGPNHESIRECRACLELLWGLWHVDRRTKACGVTNAVCAKKPGVERHLIRLPCAFATTTTG
eukprot:4256368-Amphidinium_carterae.1